MRSTAMTAAATAASGAAAWASPRPVQAVAMPVAARAANAAGATSVEACWRCAGSLAYATSGAGPPLVKAANWLSHLDYDWESPVWRHWLVELSRRFRLVRYDERGCRLSDWDIARFAFDDWVHDLEAVVDAAGLDRFALLGISQGGPVTIAYAVRHPERVRRLVLLGSFAQGRRKRARTSEELQLTEARIDMVRLGWGPRTPGGSSTSSPTSTSPTSRPSFACPR